MYMLRFVPVRRPILNIAQFNRDLVSHLRAPLNGAVKRCVVGKLKV